METSPLTWPVADLLAAYRRGTLSPVEVAADALARISRANPRLHAFLAVDESATMAQAAQSADTYRRDEAGPLEGVPISVKDVFHMAGWPTTLGSRFHVGDVARRDSGVVARLRRAGAVFTGKTNMAEFGQSATTDNLLGADAANPWDPSRTPGGSSGGAAASVAAGLSVVAMGSDGGGSIRIPAAFCGLFGLKPTNGICCDEGGFRAMTPFACPGPISWTAADARTVLQVLTGSSWPRRAVAHRRIGLCRRPQGRPVDDGVLAAIDATAEQLAALGHHVAEIDLPLDGWSEVFATLVVAEEGRARGGLLGDPRRLTDYERRTLLAAERVTQADVDQAEAELRAIRARGRGVLETVDVVVTPTTAVPAFPIGERPRQIAGEDVDRLWGAFPFTAPFNVVGAPAATVPCGLIDGLPVGAQLVAAPGRDGAVLDLAEALEAALAFDRTPVLERWST